MNKLTIKLNDKQLIEYIFKEIRQVFYCQHCMKKLTILIPYLCGVMFHEV